MNFKVAHTAIGNLFAQGQIITDQDVSEAGVDLGWLRQARALTPLDEDGQEIAPNVASNLVTSAERTAGSDAPQDGTLTFTREQIQDAMDAYADARLADLTAQLSEAQKTLTEAQKARAEAGAAVSERDARLADLTAQLSEAQLQASGGDQAAGKSK